MSPWKRHRVGLSFDVTVEGASSKRQARELAARLVEDRLCDEPMVTRLGVLQSATVRLWTPEDEDEDTRVLRPVNSMKVTAAQRIRTRPAAGNES